MHYADGTDAGHATYSVPIKLGDIVHIGNGRRLLVVDVVPVMDEESPIAGMLMVEAA